MGARTRQSELGRGRFSLATDARSEAVRNRIAAQVAKPSPEGERDALHWIEAVSEFDAPEPR